MLSQSTLYLSNCTFLHAVCKECCLGWRTGLKILRKAGTLKLAQIKATFMTESWWRQTTEYFAPVGLSLHDWLHYQPESKEIKKKIKKF